MFADINVCKQPLMPEQDTYADPDELKPAVVPTQDSGAVTENGKKTYILNLLLILYKCNPFYQAYVDF